MISGGGSINAANVAVGKGAHIADKHTVVAIADSAAGEIAGDNEITEVAVLAKSKTPDLQVWAGSDRATLAIVFTDILDSTATGQALGDEAWRAVRLAHFERSHELIEEYRGREIKTIGDSFMVVFKSAAPALDYAMALHAETGHPKVRIRAGIHVGSIDVEDFDVFGSEVNFAARVIGKIATAEIWLSDRAKKDLEVAGAKRHAVLHWERHDDVVLKGFEGSFVLWSLLNS